MADGNGLLGEVSGKFGTILIDPPWRFSNRTGKMAPEHKTFRGVYYICG